jgi:hypothetical protein
MTDQKHPRGLSDRLLASGLLPELGLDVLLIVAVSCIGVTVYRLSPALVPGYAGVLLLLGWGALMRTKAAKAPKATAE